MTTVVPVRRIAFEYPDDLNPVWNRSRPELAAAANSVSLLMPYAEPYFVRSVRAVLPRPRAPFCGRGARPAPPRLDGPLRAEADAYLRQELGHHVQHRRFNDLVVARHPALGPFEWLLGRT